MLDSEPGVTRTRGQQWLGITPLTLANVLGLLAREAFRHPMAPSSQMLGARWGHPSRDTPSHWATSLGTGTTWEMAFLSAMPQERHVASRRGLAYRAEMTTFQVCGLAIRRARYRIFFFSAL